MQSLSSFRKPVSNRSMGIELECVFDVDEAPQAGQHKGFFYVTTDPSIETGYAQRDRELVSQPLPPKWLKKELKRTWGKANYSVNNSCGIHIHVFREWLSESRAKQIHKFYSELDMVQQEYLFGRRSNDYCRMQQWDYTRYNAINNENSKTIEFRMFSSGSIEWACYCIDMVQYMIHMAKNLTIDGINAEADRLLKLHNI